MLKKLKKKLKRYLKDLVRKKDDRLNYAHFGLFLHSHSKKHENRDCLLYNK